MTATTKAKNHNSILFLTTLSVYLGLVLVGATPQVLAQAALTRQFDIKTEIEVEDDLDKKPDDEKALDVYAAALRDLFLLARDFSAKNAEQLGSGTYEFDCYLNVYSNSGGRMTKCTGGSGLFTGGFIGSFEKISEAFPHTREKEKPQTKVNLVLSENEFFLKVVLAQDFNYQAEQYSGFYAAGLSRINWRRNDDPQRRAIIYQNTSVSFENDQVFIVTRLPRGSIEPLFAATAAKTAK